MRARGAVRRPHRALLRRAAAPACTRCSSTPAPRAPRTTRSSARAGAGATRRPATQPTRLAAAFAAQGIARRRARADADRQPARVRLRAAGPAAPRRDRGAGGRARAAARASPTSPASAARKAIVFDDALADRVPDAAEAPALGLRVARRRQRRRRLAALARDAAGLAGRHARDRRRGDPLHLGHHRPAQGRDADAPGHRAFGAALRGLHAAGAPTTARRWRCRPATSPGWSRSSRRCGASGGAVIVVPEFKADAFVRLLAHERVTPHADGAGDVPAVPARARPSPAPTSRAGASAATAARRCRWRPSTRWRARLPGLIAAQLLRRHRDHLAGDHDAGRPDARACRFGRRRRCPPPTSA